MSRGLEQLDVLHGEWTSVSDKYLEGRGHMMVAPTKDNWEVSEDGKDWRVDLDLTYNKGRA